MVTIHASEGSESVAQSESIGKNRLLLKCQGLR